MRRLQTVYRELVHADITFEAWSVLETNDELLRDAPALRATDGRGAAPRSSPQMESSS